MAKTARILGIFLASAGFLVTMAPAAQAQTYVYPIGTSYGTTYPSNYGSTGCVNLTNYLSIGSTDLFTNGQVSQLQQYLNSAGYLSGVSGTFDSGTYGAVISFQVAHGISSTGTVGPVTRAAINSASCGYGYGYTAPVTTVYPNYSNYYPTNNINNCGYNNNSVDRYSTPAYDSYNNYVYENSCNVTLNSAVASYSYSNMTITLSGYGFSSGVNNIHFNGSTYIAYSSNGTTLTFTAPNSYYSGNYSIYVVNSNGISSNTLTFPINSSSNNYGNTYNSNGTVSLSSISGSTSVQTGSTNTWNVGVSSSAYNSYNQYNNNQNTSVTVNWGDNTTTNSQQVNLYGSQNLSFSHQYRNPGTYTIRMTATGNNGSYSYQNLTVTVYGNSYGYNW